MSTVGDPITICSRYGRFLTVAITAFVIGMFWARPLARQDQASPVFTARVQSVEVNVRVTDRNGTVVRDLTRDDFTILDNDVPQTIDAATFVDHESESPITPLRPGVPERDTATNADGGRMWVALLGGVGERARRAARTFVEQAMGPHDQMAIVNVHGTMSRAQGFTRNRALLLGAIDRLGEEPANPGLDAVSTAYRVLEDVCIRLGLVGGRKAVLFFDPPAFFGPKGPDRTPPGPGRLLDQDDERYLDQLDAIRAATRNNVAVYVVSTAGLSKDSDLKAMAGQRLLAEETGGDAIVNTNNFAGGYQRFVRDSDQYYLLGYTPAVEQRDGEFHKLTVRVNRPGVTVRARTGYYAPAATTRPRQSLEPVVDAGQSRLSPAALDALRMPLSVNGISVDVFAAPFRGPDGRAIVWVGAQLRPDALRLGGGELLELGFVGTSTEGNTAPGTFHVARLDLSESSRKIVRSTGLPFMDRLVLPAGRHQIRFVAHQPNGRTGMVVADVDVPDFRAAPLSMSGIVLAKAPAIPQAVIRRDDAIQRLLLDAYPTAVRTFSRQELLTTYVEVYTDGRTQVRETVAKITRVGQSRSREVDLIPLAADNQRLAFRHRFVLRDFEPGDYVLTIDSRAGRQSATRSVLLTITDR